MAIRTGEQLRQSLPGGRQLFIDGDRVKGITTDLRFAAAAQSLAQVYDMQHDPALIEQSDLSLADQRRARWTFVRRAPLDRRSDPSPRYGEDLGGRNPTLATAE